MVAVVLAATAVVVTVNVPLDCPAGMVMLPGTDAALLLLDRLTRAPCEGAGVESVTTPVEICPPITLEGDISKLFKEISAGVFPPLGKTVNGA